MQIIWKPLLGLSLVSCVAPGEHQVQLSQLERDAVESEIRDSLERLAVEFEDRGAAAYLDVYDIDDPAFRLVADGVWLHADPERYRSNLGWSETVPGEHELEIDQVVVRVLDRDRATISGRFRMRSNFQGQSERSQRGFLSGLAHRADGHWKLIEAHWSHGSPAIGEWVQESVKVEVGQLLERLCADLEARGPIAWIDHFSESPKFHMASDGTLMFQTSLDLRSAMEGFAVSVESLRLRFIDARVLPFDRDRAHIAARFEEDLIYKDGRAEPMAGHFSAVAVREDGDWRLLNAHWSQQR